MCPFINFFPVIGTNKINCLTSILNNINQYLVILPTENIFILLQSFNLLSEIWNSGLSFHVNVCVFYVNASHSICDFYVNASYSVCVFYVNASHFVSVFYVNAIVILFVNVMVEKLLQSKYPYL